VPAKLRRALRERDGGCRFPGCTERRWVDAHHVWHWAHGGPTKLTNLMLLCRFHHRLVHEGGFRIAMPLPGRFRFYRPDRTLMPDVPEQMIGKPSLRDQHAAVVGPDTIGSAWAGDKLDVGLAVANLLASQTRAAAS
jgi:hypothetical protein